MKPTELAMLMDGFKREKLDQDLVDRFLAHVQERDPSSRAYWVSRVHSCRTASGKEALMQRCLG